MTTPSSAEPRVANPPPGFPTIVAHLVYDDVGGAVDWLSRVFGFRERTAARHTEQDGRVSRAQLEVADSLITVGRPTVHGDSPRRGVSSMLYVYIDDVDEHYRRARAAGATIAMELEDRAWGDRSYQVTDPEGHHWVFAQHIRDVDLTDEHLVAG
jgi:uncharacterized glyoxalase superfamily protein PhnB